jgi:hypothetical protein
MLNELCSGFEDAVEKLDPKDGEFAFELRLLVTRLVQAIAVLVGDNYNQHGEIPALLQLCHGVLVTLSAETDLDASAEEPDRRCCRYHRRQATLNLVIFCHTVAEFHGGSKFDQRRNVDTLKSAVANALSDLVRDDR